jgi:DNA-binding response OmpR family regulator
MNKKILILEDSDVSIAAVELALAKQFDLKIARTVKEARSKIGNHSFDLFLFDIHLPDGNGFDFYSEIVELGHAKCPIIFFSSSRDKEKILQGMELGQCDYIFKPFNPEELKARIETQLAIFEKNLIHVEFEKEILKAEFGHQIINPLTSILNAFKGLKRSYPIENDNHTIILERNLERLLKFSEKFVELNRK